MSVSLCGCFLVLLKDLPIPAHMDRQRILKLAHGRKLKRDKSKGDKGEEGSSGTATSQALGVSGKEFTRGDKRSSEASPGDTGELSKKAKQYGSSLDPPSLRGTETPTKVLRGSSGGDIQVVLGKEQLGSLSLLKGSSSLPSDPAGTGLEKCTFLRFTSGILCLSIWCYSYFL